MDAKVDVNLNVTVVANLSIYLLNVGLSKEVHIPAPPKVETKGDVVIEKAVVLKVEFLWLLQSQLSLRLGKMILVHCQHRLDNNWEIDSP